MKRFNHFPLILVISLCVLLFAACESKIESTTAQSETVSEQTTLEQTTPAVTTETTTQTPAPTLNEEQVNISIEIVFEDGSSKIIPLTTVCTNLADALTSSGIAQGKDEQYGFTIYTVDGVTADFVNSSTYWAISVNGESAQTGASGIELENGGIYTLTFSVYS